LIENYQIAIYTRFNVPIQFAGVENRPNIHLDNDWLTQRVKLFQDLCLPSVEGQTEKNFTWFICFAEETPCKYVDQVCLIDQIIPIFAGSQTQAIERSKPYLLEQGLAVTTRLDSDDSLAFNYLEALLQCAESIGETVAGEDYVLSFANGCSYDVEHKKYYDHYYPHSPFIAFCESVGANKQLKGIFHEAHFCMHETYKTLLIPTKKPMWRINIHDDNVANTIKGKQVNESFDPLFSC
jgi:hypothetical protein